MTRWIQSTACILAYAGSLIGKEATPPPAFDADLYRRDEQVFSVHGDFLYWSIQEGALDYALQMEHGAWGPSQCYAQGDFKNATFNLDPGFRVAMSFFRAPKYWEIWWQYTRLTARGTNSSSKPGTSNEYLTGTWPQIFSDAMTQAKSHIHMNYNTADVWFDRVFLPNPHLKLRFLGGASVAWIDQFWKIEYFDAASDETAITNRWKFVGGGLKIGTLFDWYWFTNIYMTGGTTFAALLGSYSNESLQTANFAPVEGAYNPSIPLRNAHFKDVRPAFTGQFYLGPSYQRNFSNNRIEIFVGYELIAWMNLQENFHSTSGSPAATKETWLNTGMIALQGLTSRVTVDF